MISEDLHVDNAQTLEMNTDIVDQTMDADWISGYLYSQERRMRYQSTQGFVSVIQMLMQRLQHCFEGEKRRIN